jgi:ornithine cyclodeaminase/alanine dehydrogenase-like protein (mu-crystallin family)
VIRYLSEREVEQCRPTVREGIDLCRRALVALARDQVQLPPKPSVLPRPGCFSNVMPAFIDDGTSEQLGLKWVSVYPINPPLGIPLITGVIVLCNPVDGRPRAIMGAAFETGIRTAGVSGACMEALAPAAVGHVGITGAGVQTRTHLEVCEELGHHDVTVFARRREAGEELLAWAAARTPALRLTIADNARDAVAGAGIIVTGVPIGAAGALLDPPDVRDDALVLPLDYGTSVGADIAGPSHLYADDVPQFCRFVEKGAFPGYREPESYTGEALLAPRPSGRIVCQNLGQGAADMLFAGAIADRAEREGVGTLLEA